MPNLSGFSPLLIVLVVLSIIAVIAVVYRVTRRSSDTNAQRPSRVPGAVRAIALVSALLTVVGTLIAVVSSALGEAVEMVVPVQPFQLAALPQVSDLRGPTAQAVGGPGFTEGVFVVEGLDAAARAWLAAGHLVNGGVLVAIFVVVASLAARAREDEPFADPLSPVLAKTGIALSVGSIVWQVCFIVAGNLAAQQLFGVTGFQADGLSLEDLDRYESTGLGSSGLPQPGLEGTVEFWPIGVGLALIALAAVFRSAERMQHEVKGLV